MFESMCIASLTVCSAIPSALSPHDDYSERAHLGDSSRPGINLPRLLPRRPTLLERIVLPHVVHLVQASELAEPCSDGRVARGKSCLKSNAPVIWSASTREKQRGGSNKVASGRRVEVRGRRGGKEERTTRAPTREAILA